MANELSTRPKGSEREREREKKRERERMVLASLHRSGIIK
jgi:hypothetical protein